MNKAQKRYRKQKLLRQKEVKQERVLRQEQLLSNFEPDSNYYQEKHIGDKWYVKLYNPILDRWIVAIYTEASFERYNNYNQARRDFEYNINKDD